MPKNSFRRFFLMVLLFAAASSGHAQQDNEGLCGPLSAGHYGPFDYRSAQPSQRALVENAHFRTETFSRLQGITGPAGGDINYTLRAFPNHPRALDAMVRLAEREGRDPPRSAMYTVECYFDRAIRFRPDDLMVRMLYANFLIKKKRQEEALRQLDFVSMKAGDNPMTHFNAGLLYAEAQAWEKARLQAHTAIALGYPRLELQQRLKEAGKWVEPANADAAAAPAAEAASATNK